MKLASLEPLSAGFVEGLSETHGRGMNDGPEYLGRDRVQEEAPPGEEMNFAADDLEGGSPEEDEEALADVEVADDEMGGEMDGADAGRMISVDDFLSALETALEGVMGDEVEIDSDEMADEDPGADEIETDVAIDAVADEETEMEDEMMQESVDEEATTETTDEEVTTETTDEEVTTETTDELVEQITKRVAARILKSALTKK
jgi:hypothetical protein